VSSDSLFRGSESVGDGGGKFPEVMIDDTEVEGFAISLKLVQSPKLSCDFVDFPFFHTPKSFNLLLSLTMHHA
jgi:hypothetical protein